MDLQLRSEYKNYLHKFMSLKQPHILWSYKTSASFDKTGGRGECADDVIVNQKSHFISVLNWTKSFCALCSSYYSMYLRMVMIDYQGISIRI